MNNELDNQTNEDKADSTPEAPSLPTIDEKLEEVSGGGGVFSDWVYQPMPWGGTGDLNHRRN
ncbi:MAG TPA: hypothetical protein VGF45_21880 [Polyangia bacterium]